jgi:sugar/nucleoside kinase (ribokinase family)
MAIDDLGEPWGPEEARGWLGRALADADWVHAGALTQADFPAETLAALARGRVLSLDGQGLVRRAALGDLVLDGDYDPDVLRHVRVLKLARDELDALGLELTESSLGSLGVPEVAVTLGKAGAVVYADGLAEHLPTIPLEGVDPTGAGDSWTTAYLCYRRQRHSPSSAARLANGAVGAALAR